MATLRFVVKSKVADDPEATTLVEWTAAEIRASLPQFAALFPDGCDEAFPSLTFTTDVYRYTIDPLVNDYLHDQKDERAVAEQARAAAAAEDLEVSDDGELPF
jgi:hypothetical protein